VTSRLEADCSAKRRCRLSVISLHGTLTTCPSDLKAYIQLAYDCVKGELMFVFYYLPKYDLTELANLDISDDQLLYIDGPSVLVSHSTSTHCQL